MKIYIKLNFRFFKKRFGRTTRSTSKSRDGRLGCPAASSSPATSGQGSSRRPRHSSRPLPGHAGIAQTRRVAAGTLGRYRAGQRERQWVGGDQPNVLRADQLPPVPAAVVEVEQAQPRKVAVRDPEPAHRPCASPNHSIGRDWRRKTRGKRGQGSRAAGQQASGSKQQAASSKGASKQHGQQKGVRQGVRRICISPG